MTEPIHIVCPHCHATNRARPDKLAIAKCGQCGRQLFTGRSAELTGHAFGRHIERNEIPVVVDFWASWCGPCRMMAPEFEQAARQLEPSVRFAKVNTEDERDIAGRYGIQSIPTIVIFHGGREVARQSGALTASQLIGWIRSRR